MSEDDILIIRRVLTGSRDDFALLVERYKNLVFSLALRFFNNSAEADDAAQEAFVRAYSKLSTFRIEYDFKNWLCAVALNVCRDMLRRSAHPARAAASIADCDGNIAAPVSGVSSPSAAASKSLLKACIARLPANYRAVIILRYFDGKTYEEIAAATSFPVGTVKTYLFRAQKALHKMYRGLSGGG